MLYRLSIFYMENKTTTTYVEWWDYTYNFVYVLNTMLVFSEASFVLLITLHSVKRNDFHMIFLV
jgi:hypothetical protein